MATARSARKARAQLAAFADDRIVLERLADAIRERAYRSRLRAWLIVGEARPPRRDTMRLPADSYGMVRRRATD